MLNYMDRFSRNPLVCNGLTVVKGTRVPIRTVLANLADGESFEQILKSYPSLKEEDIKAVVAFAAVSAEEDLPLASMPGAR
jgi:uncharacterized protein (DUF433 family)